MKPIDIKMERGAAIARIPDQGYYYNSELRVESGVEIWSYTGGEYRKVRKSDKNMINPNPSAKKGTMDTNRYDVYFVDKSKMEATEADRFYLPVGAGGDTAVVVFTYRIIDAPTLIDAIHLSKRQYSHVALKEKIFYAILECIEKFGAPVFRQETLESDLSAYASKLYKQISETAALGYLGVEILSLKISLK